MDEQRLEAYVNLIQQLLSCSTAEELNVTLQGNFELVDAGLIQTVRVFAQQVAENGQEERANWLLQLAEYLERALGMTSSATPAEYFNFLIEILQAVERDPNPEVIYPILQQNLDKLDENLSNILSNWVSENLPTFETEQADAVTEVIFNFSRLMQEFPLGNIANNKEIAINGYERVLTFFTQTDFPVQWAATQNNLASAYSNRIRGDRAQNLERAIEGYENALIVYTQT
ncbi:tetratricopeptide repeat protein, partial [Merismopedia glauca]